MAAAAVSAGGSLGSAFWARKAAAVVSECGWVTQLHIEDPLSLTREEKIAIVEHNKMVDRMCK